MARFPGAVVGCGFSYGCNAPITDVWATAAPTRNRTLRYGGHPELAQQHAQPVNCCQLRPKRGYFRSRSASLAEVRRVREAAKRTRPASDSERLFWQVSTTWAS